MYNSLFKNLARHVNLSPEELDLLYVFNYSTKLLNGEENKIKLL